MIKWILVPKEIDLEKYYYDEDNEDEYIPGYNFDGGWFWFNSWFDIKIGEETKFLDEYTYQTTQNEFEKGLKTISCIFDSLNLYNDFNDILSSNMETNARDWNEYINECLNSNYKVIGIHQ